MEDFVPFEIAVKLKEKGFKEKCLFAYNDEQVINPKIVEEYGNLTDDGYYELTEDCGGKLKFDDVYIYEQQIILQDKIIIKRNFIDAPTISQVLKWLREERKIHIEIGFGCYGFCWDLTLNIKYVEGYNNSEWDLLDLEKYKEIDNQGNHSTYEQCALCAIEYILDNLI